MPINISTQPATFAWQPAAWLRVIGEDAESFLQGQFTNDLRAPRAGGAVYGLWLNVPCVGCAKSRLWGTFREPDRKAGASAPLTYQGEVIGRVVRSRTGAGPLYISPGHRIDLASAVRVVLSSCRGYRLPEPTRQAHLYVNALRRGDLTC